MLILAAHISGYVRVTYSVKLNAVIAYSSMRYTDGKMKFIAAINVG